MTVEMKTIMTTFTETITGTIQHIQQVISNYLQSEKITALDLATFIKDDTSTLKSARQLLGITYHKYELNKDELLFVLETKGEENEKILSLTVYNKGQAIIKYRSYDRNASPDKTFTLMPLTH